MSKTILLVDGNPVFLKALSIALRDQGYEVTSVPDGSSAVNAARNKMPDLIILDLHYPPDVANGGGVSWDGFLIVDWIRRMADFSKTRIIFTTQDDPKPYVDRAIKAGACSLFQKAPDLTTLLSIVHRFLGVPAAPV